MAIIKQDFGEIGTVSVELIKRDNITVNTSQEFNDIVNAYGIIVSYNYNSSLICEFIIEDGVATILYSNSQNGNVNTVSMNGTTLTLNSSNGVQLGNVSYHVFRTK